ncbi:MAG: hypothetical protein KKB90_12320 [Actinobacteria bacterium]|nr:hypothetical protein [Actinomycetota bacterium]MCG2819027.1 hypothetical protein [Actinomycetes bacterium]MBU4219731.1 hypothetical protein [Actinomycetota bacterium]MBU4357660.1 hypothetical protein [Actinomycetota bacterium]MBU4391921.1 hypothetical protein [Actinomycetota bacterium]
MEKMKAFGINGCRVTGVHTQDHELSLDVDKHVDSVTDVVIKVMGSAPVTGVNVNEKPASMTPDGDYRTVPRTLTSVTSTHPRPPLKSSRGVESTKA